MFSFWTLQNTLLKIIQFYRQEHFGSVQYVKHWQYRGTHTGSHVCRVDVGDGRKLEDLKEAWPLTASCSYRFS